MQLSRKISTENEFYKRKLLGKGELSFSYNYLDAYDNILKTRLDGSNYHNLNIKLSYFISDKIKTRLSYKYSSLFCENVIDSFSAGGVNLTRTRREGTVTHRQSHPHSARK